MAASQEHDRIASGFSNWARQLELSYVLIADANGARVKSALETVRRFKVAILVARDGLQAIEIVRRFGAPKLLVVDLSLPRKDGIAVIDVARGEPNRTTEIVAWADREPSQFAGERLSRMKVRTLRGPVSDVALAEAIESALERMALERAPVTATATADPEPSQYLDRLMRGLAESARLLCGTAGAAVYVRALGETKFRAFVTWACDAAVPQSPYYTPKVFDWVLETGESLVFPALDAEQLPLEASTAKDPVRGLVAVPMVSRLEGSAAEQVIGAICVFDVKHLNVDVRQVDALKALGRNISLQPATPGQADTGGASAAAVADTPADNGSDPLVLVLDRRDGELAVTREIARARREQRQLSIVLFGIDAVGHADQAAVRVSLTQLAKVLIRAVRESDLVIDWGQQELVTVLPGLGASEARQVAERVRAAMQVGARFQVAVSAGVEELQNNDVFAHVVERAREKVRTAREHGHNRVA
jgi:diguanylate cyclase (GGDEF)-like protein